MSVRGSDLKLVKEASLYTVDIPREGLINLLLRERNVWDDGSLFLELEAIPGVDSGDYGTDTEINPSVFFSIASEHDTMATQKKIRNTIAKHLRKKA